MCTTPVARRCEACWELDACVADLLKFRFLIVKRISLFVLTFLWTRQMPNSLVPFCP